MSRGQELLAARGKAHPGVLYGTVALVRAYDCWKRFHDGLERTGLGFDGVEVPGLDNILETVAVIVGWPEQGTGAGPACRHSKRGEPGVIVGDEACPDVADCSGCCDGSGFNAWEGDLPDILHAHELEPIQRLGLMMDLLERECKGDPEWAKKMGLAGPAC
jgi:hypothetical protein